MERGFATQDIPAAGFSGRLACPAPIRITFLVPTRNRPDGFWRLVTSLYDFIPQSIQVVGLIDEDQQGMYGLSRFPGIVRRIIGLTQQTMVAKVNSVCKHFAAESDLIAVIDDDKVARTKDWEKQVTDAYIAGATMIGTNDLLQGDKLGGVIFMDSRIVKALGYVFPPGLFHLYTDNFQRALAEAIGGWTYLPGVVFEHLHPFAKKVPMDSQYERLYSKGMWQHDEIEYQRFMNEDFAAAVKRVKEVM